MDLNISIFDSITITEYTAWLRRDIWYVDYVNGSAGNDGRSWATAKKKIQECVGTNLIVHVAKSPDPVSLGNVTFTKGSNSLTLASAQTLTVSDCESAWVASANVTCTTTTTRKENANASNIAIATAFTTGLAAYKALAASTDYSSYAKITFWIRSSIAVTASYLQLALCSDTVGAVPVDQFTIPFKLEINRWYPVTLARSGGGSLGNAIQSVALYVLTDVGTPTIIIDNIEACNDFHLQSLIGKNTSGEHWHSLRSIKGTAVYIGSGQDLASANSRAYVDSSGTVTGYYRNTIVTQQDLATATTTTVQSVAQINTDVIGGYNTGTNLVDGLTFYDGLNGWGYGILAGALSNIVYKNLGVTRYYRGIYTGGATPNLQITDMYSIGNDAGGFEFYQLSGNAGCLLTRLKAWGCLFQGMSGLVMGGNVIIDDLRVDSNNQQGLGSAASSVGGKIKNFYSRYNTTYGISNGSTEGIDGWEFEGGAITNNASGALWSTYGSVIGCTFRDIVFDGNGSNCFVLSASVVLKFINCEFKNHATRTIQFAGTYNAAFVDLLFIDCKMSDPAFMNDASFHTPTAPSMNKIRCHNYNQVKGDHRIYMRDGVQTRNTVDYRTASPCVQLARSSSGTTANFAGMEARFQAPLDNGQGRTLSVYGKIGGNFDGEIYVGAKINDQWVTGPTKVDLGTAYSQINVSVNAGSALEDGIVELVVYCDNFGPAALNKYVYLDDFEWS